MTFLKAIWLRGSILLPNISTPRIDTWIYQYIILLENVGKEPQYLTFKHLNDTKNESLNENK